jgi:hypothetical protein
MESRTSIGIRDYDNGFPNRRSPPTSQQGEGGYYETHSSNNVSASVLARYDDAGVLHPVAHL